MNLSWETASHAVYPFSGGANFGECVFLWKCGRMSTDMRLHEPGIAVSFYVAQVVCGEPSMPGAVGLVENPALLPVKSI